MLVKTPEIIPTHAARIIQKFISKFLQINAVNPELITTNNVEIDFIIGMTIAINVKGIINCKSKNSGRSPPKKIPVRVDNCHDKNRVIMLLSYNIKSG